MLQRLHGNMHDSTMLNRYTIPVKRVRPEWALGYNTKVTDFKCQQYLTVQFANSTRLQQAMAKLQPMNVATCHKIAKGSSAPCPNVLTGFPHLLENLEKYSTPGKPRKIMEFCKK